MTAATVHLNDDEEQRRYQSKAILAHQHWQQTGLHMGTVELLVNSLERTPI